MTEADFHTGLAWVYLGIGGIVALSSAFVTAPYGRHGGQRWGGPLLPGALGWLLMELPQPVGMALCFAGRARAAGLAALVCLSLWMGHYAYRTLLYPFLTRTRGFALTVVATGFVLNIGFSYLNGRHLFSFGPDRPPSWLVDGRFLVGGVLFVGGFLLCASSDQILRDLRRPGDTGYHTPTRGAFRWVSSPNYLGEIVEWAGWALATWSLAGLGIALITAANLVPRALANHRWCREHLPGYPADRKALIPFLL